MNYWLYIGLIAIGMFVGGVIVLLILRKFISSKELHIGKNKVKGQGNTQEVDAEFQEAEQLNRREQRKKTKAESEQEVKLKAEADKKRIEITKLLKE